ncbi:MAG: hypothetical protein LBU51_08385 [Bacteroidales bacterium]|jgi:hypothetical protein|nr:hypothetical protein [Bacteroidales bacterium]
MKFDKKQLVLIGAVSITALILALIIYWATYLRYFPLKKGSKNKFVSIWQDILILNSIEKNEVAWIESEVQTFGKETEYLTKWYYGIDTVDRTIFEKERKKYKV